MLPPGPKYQKWYVSISSANLHNFSSQVQLFERFLPDGPPGPTPPVENKKKQVVFTFECRKWYIVTPITFASFATFGPENMIIWQCWWPVWSRDMYVKPSIVMNILSSIVMDVPSRKIGIVESVVFISRSSVLTSIVAELPRWKCELFVDILRGWNEFESSITF